MLLFSGSVKRFWTLFFEHDFQTSRKYCTTNLQESLLSTLSPNNAIEPEKFNSVMRNVPSPVVVVTTVSERKSGLIKRGITCSSFTSVSFNPAIVSFCVNRPSRIQSILEETKQFAVHVLSDDQVNHSIFFSKPSIDEINQFESVPHSDGPHGVPIIDNVAAVLQCEAYETHDVGDHTVWYGLVKACHENHGKNPLLYYNRTFHNLGDQAFMDAFERAQLKFKDWTHEAHLRMAWNYMKKHGMKEALPLIRTGIRNFNNQNKDRIKHGYNETITRFYAHFVNIAVIDSPDCTSFEDFILKNEFLLNKDLMFIYYSKEVIFSEKAKSQFVPPDKIPFSN